MHCTLHPAVFQVDLKLLPPRPQLTTHHAVTLPQLMRQRCWSRDFVKWSFDNLQVRLVKAVTGATLVYQVI